MSLPAHATFQLSLYHDGCKPFLKWAGGKGQLLPELVKRLPKSYNRYFEPFVGAGALFFHLAPEQACLSDINAELINCFLTVRDDVASLIRDLKRHKHDESYYYRMRALDRSPGKWAKLSAVRRASRTIYLNRTCYNGLYRVNGKGEFNVPFGKYKNPTICDAENLQRCSALLRQAEIRVAPFFAVLKHARKGDFVYFDPPYAPLSATANFTSYHVDGFEAQDQEALRDVVRTLTKRGVKVMLSNSNASSVLKLYSDFNLEFVQASRAINSKGTQRGKIREVIVTNY